MSMRHIVRIYSYRSAWNISNRVDDLLQQYCTCERFTGWLEGRFCWLWLLVFSVAVIWTCLLSPLHTVEWCVCKIWLHVCGSIGADVRVGSLCSVPLKLKMRMGKILFGCDILDGNNCTQAFVTAAIAVEECRFTLALKSAFVCFFN